MDSVYTKASQLGACYSVAPLQNGDLFFVTYKVQLVQWWWSFYPVYIFPLWSAFLICMIQRFHCLTSLQHERGKRSQNIHPPFKGLIQNLLMSHPFTFPWLECTPRVMCSCKEDPPPFPPPLSPPPPPFLLLQFYFGKWLYRNQGFYYNDRELRRNTKRQAITAGVLFRNIVLDTLFQKIVY